MYTIIRTNSSGAHQVTVTDSEDVMDLVVDWLKNYSAARKIEVLHPNYQTRDIYHWDSKAKFWHEQKDLEIETL